MWCQGHAKYDLVRFDVYSDDDDEGAGGVDDED